MFENYSKETIVAEFENEPDIPEGQFAMLYFFNAIKNSPMDKTDASLLSTMLMQEYCPEGIPDDVPKEAKQFVQDMIDNAMQLGEELGQNENFENAPDIIVQEDFLAWKKAFSKLSKTELLGMYLNTCHDFDIDGSDEEEFQWLKETFQDIGTSKDAFEMRDKMKELFD